jgi:hypothetical protein
MDSLFQNSSTLFSVSTAPAVFSCGSQDGCSNATVLFLPLLVHACAFRCGERADGGLLYRLARRV